ncbi:membrane-associated tyrosine and threonine-specific cdc2-inhibitory kinase [Diplogelasinospora grovesii]|uniref:Membrane-associated tyrosine and threonine-specific cdc2-inhibitory kinase n=1 Tax=Diplogelasinospora grovesii TaxID=303347 RepID=A0AAN6N794_9PEZI|nr:membrane-associated tyrosine and threonine-specific cdc2-inhibitory kinase [Diplogelasinospora grovesii]
MERPQDDGYVSETTNECTPSEVAAMMRRIKSQAPAHVDAEGVFGAEGAPKSPDRDDDHGVSPHENSIRVILRPSADPVRIKLSPYGIADPQPRTVILDANANPHGATPVSSLALAQSSADTEAGPRKLYCRLIFDLARDWTIVINKGKDFVTLRKLPDEQDGPQPMDSEQRIQPRNPTAVNVGSWAVFAKGHHLLDFLVLPRLSTIVEPRQDPDETEPQQASKKRALDPSQPEAPSKRVKQQEGDGQSGDMAVFQAPATAAAPLAESSTTHHPLGQLLEGQTAKVFGPKGEDYTLTRGKNIALRPASHVFEARDSRSPGHLAVVKVVRAPAEGDPAGVVHAAEMWMREVRNHSKLTQHAAVVCLNNHDARYLTLYMEHVDAPGLDCYRSGNSNPMCILGSVDARRIFTDISAALSFIHGQGVVHDDIKPGNILFSKARGAVLIDFGLSSPASDNSGHTGGTPWYIPPEFMESRTRGVAGDVWAFGVVMLFLLRKLALPERMSPLLNWRIADINGEGEETDKARTTMRQWIEGIEEIAQRLGTQGLAAQGLARGSRL